MSRLLELASQIESSTSGSSDDGIDWYALSNGLSTVMPDGTLIQPADDTPAATPPVGLLDTAEDTPGLPNFLNLAHPHCWRNQMGSIGAKEQQLRDLKAKRVNRPRSAEKPKPVHPADAADLGLIETATSFFVQLFHNGGFHKKDADSIADAFVKGAAMEKATGSARKSMVYAVLASGRALLVPTSYKAPETKQETTKMETATAKAATPKKAVKKKAPRRAGRALGTANKPTAIKRSATTTARKPVTASTAAPSGKKETKSDIVERMLKQPGGTTSAELSTATGWPRVNLKVAAERAAMTLWEKDGKVGLSAKKGK